MAAKEPEDLFACRIAAHELINHAYAFSRQIIKTAEIWNLAPFHECAHLDQRDLAIWAIDHGIDADERLSRIAWGHANDLQDTADALMNAHQVFHREFEPLEEEFAIGGQCVTFLNFAARSHAKALSEFAWHLLTETCEAIDAHTIAEEWDQDLEAEHRHGIRPSAIPKILEKTCLIIDGIDVESSTP